MRGTLRVLMALATLAPANQAQEPGGDVVLETVVVELPDGQEVEFELGTLYVPEVRGDPYSREISVGFARFPALGEATAPPVFRLPGGPGSSFVEPFLGTDLRQQQRLLEDLASERAFADVVLVDQRGFSRVGDVLMAPYRRAAPSGRTQTQDEAIAEAVEFARSTAARYEESEIDLAGYTVKECAADVRDLALALGYERITLFGTSFGSQWSFAVMRQHPEIVARALLSGVEPLNDAYDMPSYVFAAIQRMWCALDQDEGFAPYLPPGGMAEVAETVVQRLEREPLTLDVDGAPFTVHARDLPLRDPVALLELYHGRHDNVLGQIRSSGRGVMPRFLPLIGALIDTSLGVTPMRRHRLWTDPAVRYVGRNNFAGHLAAAEFWPSPDVGDEFRTPVLCDIPVVFAQGTWDLSTPVENTFEIAPYFPNSRVLIAERGGHGVLGPIEREQPAVWAELDEFLRSGDLEGIPAWIELSPSQGFAAPRFALDDSPPPAAPDR